MDPLGVATVSYDVISFPSQSAVFFFFFFLFLLAVMNSCSRSVTLQLYHERQREAEEDETGLRFQGNMKSGERNPQTST